MIRVVPPPGFVTVDAADILITSGAESEVILNPIRLKTLPRIEGLVLGADDRPEPSVLISSLNLIPPTWTITDREGKFSIQLGKEPYEEKARFRAEHARRFLRGDFEVDFERLAPIEVRLERFKPNADRSDKEHGTDDLSLMLGKKAPEIACTVWFNSEPLQLENLRGKVVVLTLWGGFAEHGPARDRIEEVRALSQLLHDADDVVFIGVHDAASEPGDIWRYVKSYEITFPVGADAEPFLTFDRYHTNVIPQTFLIDKQGILRYMDVGGRLLELIKSLRRMP